MEIPFVLVFLSIGTAIAVMQESRSEPVIIRSDSEANIYQIRTIREPPKRIAATPIIRKANAKFDSEHSLFEEDSLLPRKQVENHGASRNKQQAVRSRAAQERRQVPIPRVPDSSPSFGVPSPSDGDRTVNEVNVKSPAQVSHSDKAKYDAYADFVKLLRESVNLAVDPCENFEQYVCGNYGKQVEGNERNHLTISRQMEDSKYDSPTTSEAINKTVRFYNECKKFRSNYTGYVQRTTIIKKIMDDFSADTNWKFPMFSDPSLPQQTYDVQALSRAMALLSRQGVHTLVRPSVETNREAPQHYVFFLHLNSRDVSKALYETDTSDANVKSIIKNKIMHLVKNYANVISETMTLNSTLLDQYVEELAEFEYELATAHSTNGTIVPVKKYTMATASAAFTFLDFDAYFKALSGDNVELNTYLSTSTFFVTEPEKLAMLNGHPLLKSTKMINYLFYRLLAANKDYLKDSSDARVLPYAERTTKLLRRRQPLEKFVTDKYPGDSKMQCAYEANTHMPYSSGRFFVDSVYPDDDSKKTIKNSVGYIVDNVLLSFRGMLNRLDWMTPKSKIGAYNKIDQLVTNIAYPDFILNDTLLDSYYSALVFNEGDDYYAMRRKIQKFNFELPYINLRHNTPVDRNDFSRPPGESNAWYMPHLNSITLPAGILQHPHFDLNWPASLNYGALGVTVGHELVHAFDNQEINFDGVGAFKQWMDRESMKNFTAMADCLVKQYSGFCPLKDTDYHQQCIDGNRTQGENIADNGGIHAAWNSYKEYTALHEPDPQLPDATFKLFTHDQLFFLAFARSWCEEQGTAENQHKQLVSDPHSPAKYRVLGTLKNFPAFRTAFSCPALTENYCSVYVPNVRNGA